MVPLNKKLKFWTGDLVRLTGHYRDQHGCIERYQALDHFGGCRGELVWWRYEMVPPASSSAGVSQSA